MCNLIWQALLSKAHRKARDDLIWESPIIDSLTVLEFDYLNSRVKTNKCCLVYFCNIK